MLLDGCPAKRRANGRHAFQPGYCADHERGSEQSADSRLHDPAKPHAEEHAECEGDDPVTILPPDDYQSGGSSYGGTDAPNDGR